MKTIVATEKLPVPLADSYSSQLVSVEVKLEKITAMFDTLISVDRDNAAKHQDDKLAKAHSVAQKTAGLRNDVLSLHLPAIAQLTQRTTLPVGGGGAAFNFYEKKPFPKFTGKKREYLGFRQE